MKLHKIAFVLLIVGGLAWGLQAIGYGLDRWLPANLLMIVYILVGLSAIYEAVSHKNLCKECSM